MSSQGPRAVTPAGLHGPAACTGQARTSFATLCQQVLHDPTHPAHTRRWQPAANPGAAYTSRSSVSRASRSALARRSSAAAWCPAVVHRTTRGAVVLSVHRGTQARACRCVGATVVTYPLLSCEPLAPLPGQLVLAPRSALLVTLQPLAKLQFLAQPAACVGPRPPSALHTTHAHASGCVRTHTAANMSRRCLR